MRFYAFLGVFVFHVLPEQPAFYRGLPAGAVTLDGDCQVGCVRGRFVLCPERLPDYLAVAAGTPADRWHLAPPVRYIRRILRIWPLYFVVLAVAVALAHTPSQKLPMYYIVGYMLFVGNWINAAFGYPKSVCAPLWTVSRSRSSSTWYGLRSWKRARAAGYMIIAAVVTFLLATLSQIGVALTMVWSSRYIYYGSNSSRK